MLKVLEVANKTIGKTKRMKNYKQFWDKELDQLLKRRRDANRLIIMIYKASYNRSCIICPASPKSVDVPEFNIVINL